jgi:leucyl aminopeptidase
MRVNFTSKISSARNLLTCKFSFRQPSAKTGGHPSAPLLYKLQSTGQGLALKINAAHFRYQERDEAWRSAGAASASLAQKLGYSAITWDVSTGISEREFGYLAEGLTLFSYGFDRYKANGKGDTLKVEIFAGDSARAFKKLHDRFKKLNQGVVTARDLANTPANDLPPQALAAFARDLCQKRGLRFKQLTATQLSQQNYAGITAVGTGSANPPVLFTMTYEPTGARRAPELCLVGKGITFDSGGISIKPWDGMWDMKADMGGAAAVIGAMHAISLLKPRLRVTGVVAAAENMPDGRAYRPGDILRYRNGTTVEIRSTDAEGRLVLADALIYAQETLKQKRIVDLATLTGACVRALGNQYIGLLSLSKGLTAAVSECAQAAGEPVWQLPMHPEYRKMLASPIADIRNGGGPLAGASTAGWFLHEFINEGTEHVHLDIASTFLASKVDKYWSQPGATGSGVRLCAALAEKLA